jgi:hypothetical protein
MLLAWSPAGAQRRSAALFGWIRDSTRAPIEGADVEILSAHTLARTDSAGRFLIRALDPGTVSVAVRRIGYTPQAFDFRLHGGGDIDSIAVTMPVNITVLDAMHTDASMARRYADLEGFYERRVRGPGVFLTRDEIMARHTNELSETLREVAGLQIVRLRSGEQGLRFPSASSASHDCPPQYWVDGQRVKGADIDNFPATDIEGIELYQGPSTTPMAFSQTRNLATCGTVVIWTRVPGTP